jgi:hypothetical protein
MALIQAQGQLQLIWNPQSPQGSVLAITLQHSLSVLAAPAPAGRWKPTFTQAQLLELAQLAMAEAAQHPAWASDQADGKPLLAFAWQQALHGMAKVPAGQWLSPATVQLVMHQTLKAVGMRRQLLDRLPSAEQETVLSYALDSLLGYLFHAEDSSVRWAATKSKVLHLLIEHVLHKAAIGPADTGTIDGIMGKLREQLAKISDNETFDSVVFLQELLMG